MKFYYLLGIQYLGFRYHGWARQPQCISIQQTLEKALMKIPDIGIFQTLGASRTDSMVSAVENFFELITDREILRPEQLISTLNSILPPDVKILSMRSVEKEFKIISGAQLKEYHYYFSYGEKLHPFCAPFMTMIEEDLDIELMQKASQLFVGEHQFKDFCYKLRETQNPIKKIESVQLEINQEMSASFFPKKNFVFKVKAKSFLRHQVRLMMGALFMVGMKKLSIEELEQVLQGKLDKKLITAPASGLLLKKIEF